MLATHDSSYNTRAELFFKSGAIALLAVRPFIIQYTAPRKCCTVYSTFTEHKNFCSRPEGCEPSRDIANLIQRKSTTFLNWNRVNRPACGYSGLPVVSRASFVLL